jgi:hypothetical protein
MTLETFASADVFAPGLLALRVRVDKLNRRAEKHGMNKLELRVVSVMQFIGYGRPRVDRSVSLNCRGPLRFHLPKECYRVEIAGCAPRIDGWVLAARVEFNDIIGNVVRIAPGRDDDGSFERYRTIDPICEHCNSRRNRNDIFVLEHEDGRRKVVGRNCLADFLRCDGADRFARLAEWADIVSQWADEAARGCYDGDEYEGGRGGVKVMALDQYMPVVAMLMRRIGWLGRTKCKETGEGIATADLAYTVHFPRCAEDKAWIKKEELYADAGDAELAGRAVEWAKTCDDGGNEYLHTIAKIARAGYVDFKSLDGYAASIIIAHRNACEREKERAEKAKLAKDKVWYGEEGKRSKGISVTCKGTHCFEGYYGPTTIVRFEHKVSDSEVAVLAWFASGYKERDWEADTDYVIDAMIKSHDDDAKYGKQTKINRVKVCAS